jgi:tetratricopeptide (TPR) repeat protein
MATPAGGQTPAATPSEALSAALKDYKNGNTKQSLATLLAIPPDKLTIAVRELTRVEMRPGQRLDLLEVAALALTESAAASLEQSGEQWRVLRRLGDGIGTQLIAVGDTSKTLRAWCLAADALGESLHDFATLQPLLADLRDIYKNDAEILLASGSLYETRANDMANSLLPLGRDVSMQSSAPRKGSAGFGPGVGRWLDETDRTGNLKRARDFYNEALAVRPSLAEARLRLARVLHLLGDLPGALAALDALPAEGLSQEFMYLSRLFRAGVEEDLGHADKAKAAYLAAMEWRTQAPFVGLAALLRSNGDAAAALSVTERLFHDAPDFDPWWSYLKGQGWHLTARLDEARATIR